MIAYSALQLYNPHRVRPSLCYLQAVPTPGLINTRFEVGRQDPFSSSGAPPNGAAIATLIAPHQAMFQLAFLLHAKSGSAAQAIGILTPPRRCATP
jgi:hypothetical protein